jgi:hypothetical protein
VIIPSDLSDIGGMVATVTGLLKSSALGSEKRSDRDQ